MLFLSFPVVHVDAPICYLVATALGHSSCTGSMETMLFESFGGEMETMGR